MRRARRTLGLAIAIAAALLGGYRAWQGQSSGDGLRVVRIVDGDTIVVADGGKDTTVRLIGVDTPETVHPSKPVQRFGREASRYMKELLTGRTVRLEYGEGSQSKDRYGRGLAYVYRQPDGLFVNLELVRRGYGFAYTKYPFDKLEEFRAAEREARAAGAGLWADERAGEREAVERRGEAQSGRKARGRSSRKRGD